MITKRTRAEIIRNWIRNSEENKRIFSCQERLADLYKNYSINSMTKAEREVYDELRGTQNEWLLDLTEPGQSPRKDISITVVDDIDYRKDELSRSRYLLDCEYSKVFTIEDIKFALYPFDFCPSPGTARIGRLPRDNKSKLYKKFLADREVIIKEIIDNLIELSRKTILLENVLYREDLTLDNIKSDYKKLWD